MASRLFLLASALSLAMCIPWDSANDPSLFLNSYHATPSNLPQTGVSSNIPWSDTYWPSYESGIAHRWNTMDPQDFNYNLTSLEDLKTWTSDQLSQLSPAEKFDILNSRFDYPTVNSEWQRTSPDDASWEGLCHGWAPASLYYKQPNPVTVTTPDGLQLPFGSSDVKALLTYFVAQYSDPQSQTNFVGQRCNTDLQQNPSAEKNPECRDINSGTFHILLSNMIGMQKTGFVGDRDRSIMVWNQPIYSYKFAGTPNATQVHYCYGKETQPMWDAHTTNTVCEDLTYSLEVGRNGKITGGSWTSWDRPDFLWMTTPAQFYGFFSALGPLYQKSIGGHGDVAAFATAAAASYRHAVLGMSTALTAPTGVFGITEGRRARGFKKMWSIQGTAETRAVELSFEQFRTLRHQVTVKVFEGAAGDGALVRVFHGSALPEAFVVNGSGALVVFSSDKYSSQFTGSFQAKYTLVNHN